jgi:hypothetical protein
VFGLLLGGAFAPNHIGMPITPDGMPIDFLRRQCSCHATSAAVP